MTHKSQRITESIRHLEGQGWDARYLGYFECFNRQEFYEAHDVLEDLWLEDRHGPKGDFYKALIQLAGGFVHLQKRRPGPAVALLRLATKYLSRYPDLFEGMDNLKLKALARDWACSIESSPTNLSQRSWPHLAAPLPRAPLE